MNYTQINQAEHYPWLPGGARTLQPGDVVALPDEFVVEWPNLVAGEPEPEEVPEEAPDGETSEPETAPETAPDITGEVTE